uniref:TVP38/TMEM64 family membrane protein slr0305 n=1 Tax=Neospora caninum (strain Liverpool) TaxID=572307 RepID=A0A0F7ULI1_NEOCL|nr:TPA: TVP38/TMEM64 family membrane protein slr0305 [Neospora caninum Liverpool]
MAGPHAFLALDGDSEPSTSCASGEGLCSARASPRSKRKGDSPFPSPVSPSPSSPALSSSVSSSHASSSVSSSHASSSVSSSHASSSLCTLKKGEAVVLVRLLVLVLVVGGGFCLARHFSFLQLFKDSLKDYSPRGQAGTREGEGDTAPANPESTVYTRAVLFVLLYAVGAILFVPAPVMSVAAGTLFSDDLILPVCLILAGSLLGACLSFLFSRFLLRSVVVRFVVARRPFLRAVDCAIRKEGLKILLCARMVLPYTLNNYFLGVTGVSFWEFALATFVTGFPFAFAYAAIGAELRDLDSIFSGSSSSSSSAPSLSVSSFFLSSKFAGVGVKPVLVVAACALLFAGVHTVKNVARQALAQAAKDVDAQEAEALLKGDELKVKRTE